MNIEEIVDGLASYGEEDWIALWIIVDDVAEELGLEEPHAQLEATLLVVRELLPRQWMGKPDYPDWGDGPWFAAPRFCHLDA